MIQAIILLGAPGAGKGTIAEMIRAGSAYLHVSTGDMLRAAVKAGSPVGIEARSYMEQGALVPDAVIMKIVMERMDAGARDARYLFDGFPRTLEQARLLDAELAPRGGVVTKVFCLDAPHAVLVDRIAGRRVCRQCGAVYHARNIPTKKPGVCDACGGETYQRADDNEKTVLNRLDVYEKQTAPLIEYYAGKNLVVHVRGDQHRDRTYAEIRAQL